MSEMAEVMNKPEKERDQYGEDSSDGKIRPFLSSEMQKKDIKVQMEQARLKELKKQEIQKWGYLLQLIGKNMDKGEPETKKVLNEVYEFLEKNKNDLQKEMIPERSKVDDEFTVKYS